MKKFTFAVAMALAFNLGFAQKGYNPTDVKAKAEKSNAEVADAKAGASYKTWLKRAEIFNEIADAPVAGAYVGLGEKESELLLGATASSSQVEIGGKPYVKHEYQFVDFFFEQGKLLYWSVKDAGVDSPLVTGFEAVEKAYSMDPSKSAKKVKELLGTYKNSFLKEGNNFYNLANKTQAAKYYALAYDASAHPGVNAPDTTVAYYAAYTALDAGDLAAAAKYAQICIEKKCFQNGEVYKIYADALAGQKDSQKAKEVYLKGLEQFPGNTSIIFGIINFYLSQNEDPKNVLPYLDKAIELDPKNPSLYFVKGTFYEKFKETDNAMAAYRKSVEVNPKFVESWINMGVLNYNKGVELINESNKVDVNNQAEYDKVLKLADVEFRKALEDFLKAYEVNTKDKFVVENLKNLYFRFRNESQEMMDNYKKFNDMLQAM